MSVQKHIFGKTSDGKDVYSYVLKNNNGISIRLLDYGCIIQSIHIPDKNGMLTDIVLGYSDVADYENSKTFFGAFVGRYANRILNSEFELNGITYKLDKNEGNNHLHGVFPFRHFTAVCNDNSVIFSYLSKEEEEGYPGNLLVDVIYSLNDNDEFNIEYNAVSDEDTIINLTNHSYFNLDGEGNVLFHELCIDSDCFTEEDKNTCPTGKITAVEDTPMDFRSPCLIGEVINSVYDQLNQFKGFDHNYIFNNNPGTCYLYSEKTGIKMKLTTSQPAVQLYTGNYLDIPYSGVCLETQHYPCSPNFKEFPSTVIKAGEKYKENTTLKFSKE